MLCATSDDVWQVWNAGLVLNAEAVAEVVPERDAKLGAGLLQSEESVPAITSGVTVCAAANLALGDVAADVAFGTVGVERYLRAIQHRQQLRLVGVQPCEQAVESDEAGAAAEDAIEAGAQFAASAGSRRGAIGLEVGVEPPDQTTDALLSAAMQVGERIELVDLPLGMHPAKRMLAHGELPGVVTDDDRLAQVCMQIGRAHV